MTGPKITVSADVSGVQAELAKVEAAAKRINTTLNSGQVGIDVDDAKRSLETLNRAAKGLVDNLKSAGEGGIIDADKAAEAAKALDDAAKSAQALETAINHSGGSSSGLAQNAKHARTLEDGIRRATRAQEVLSREGIRLNRQQTQEAQRNYQHLRQSGAAGASRLSPNFDDWVSGGWRNHSTSLSASERRRGEVMRHLGIGNPEAGGHRRFARMNAMAGALGGMGASMMGGGDGGMFQAAGSAAGSGIGMGAGMMMGGPVGAAVGFFASRLLGGMGGSMDRNVDKVNDESIIYSDLRKSIGETQVDFELLRGSVRHLTDGMGVAYNEAAKLAKEFVHTAGMNGKDGMNVGGELRTAIGFGRGYGIDPSQSAQFMATMRHFGVTSNEKDSKRLAVMIGESVQKGGTASKMDEVLSAVQSFAQTAMRSSLTSANVGAFSSFMSSMTGLNLSGLKGDPATAASAMGAADSAMRQGGAFGDASRSFSLGLWQKKLNGFSAYDLGYMNEQGAFGTIDKAFGRDSAAYQMAQQRGDHGKMAQYDEWSKQGGGKSILSMQMQEMESQYGYNTDKLHNSIKGHFGVSDGQAAALYSAYKNDKGLGGLQKSLSAAGIDMGTLNTKSIASLAELSSGGMGGIRTQADKLRKMKLSKGDSDLLNGADSDDKMRAAVLKLTSLYENKDSGEIARQQQADMENSLQELATKLIPLTQWMKDGVIELVRLVSKPFGGSDFVKQADREKAREAAMSSINGASDKTAAARQIMQDAAKNPGKYNQDFINSLTGEYGRTPISDNAGGMSGGKSSISKDKSDFLEKTRAAAERAAAAINKQTGSNVSAEAIQAQWGLETGWGKSVLNGTNNLGNIKAGSGWGGNSKSFRVKEYDSRGREFYTNQNFRAYGSLEESGDDYASLIARRYLNGKPAANDAEFASRLKKGGYATDPDYERKLLTSAASIRGREASEKLPSTGAFAASEFSGNQKFSFEHSITLNDRNNNPIAIPALSTNTYAPLPAGRG